MVPFEVRISAGMRGGIDALFGEPANIVHVGWEGILPGWGSCCQLGEGAAVRLNYLWAHRALCVQHPQAGTGKRQQPWLSGEKGEEEAELELLSVLCQHHTATGDEHRRRSTKAKRRRSSSRLEDRGMYKVSFSTECLGRQC